METLKNLPILLFESQSDWRNWLDKNQPTSVGLWLKFAKKDSGVKSVSYAEALDEALCYGWIDTQIQAYDQQYYLQKFTPRRPKSIWSKTNIAKTDKLIAGGKMQPAGLAAIKLAKQNGEWERAYDSSSTMATPTDFQAALDKNPKAKEFFQTLNKANVYAFNWRLQTAKNPETRQSRIEKFVEMLGSGEKFH